MEISEYVELRKNYLEKYRKTSKERTEQETGSKTRENAFKHGKNRRRDEVRVALPPGGRHFIPRALLRQNVPKSFRLISAFLPFFLVRNLTRNIKNGLIPPLGG